MASQQPPTRSWFRLASIARMEAADAAAAAAAASSSSLPPPRTPVSRPLLPTPPPPLPESQPDLPSTQLTQPTESVTAPLPPAYAHPPSPTPPESPKLTHKAPPLSALILLPQPETKPPLSASIPLLKPETKPPLSAPIALPQPETKLPLSAPTPLLQPETKPPLSASTPLLQPETKPLSAPIPIPQPETKPPLSTPIPFPQPETKPLLLPEEKPMNNVVSYNNKVMRTPPSPRLLTEAKEDRKMRVITMAGENTGAVMDFGGGSVSDSPFRNARHHILHAGTKGREEGKQEHLEGGEKWSPSAASKHMEAVVNSNVQGVNNSLVFNSSCTQHSPGVHITFASSRRAKEGCAADNAHESRPCR